ncbi:MAG: hypothetical protein A2X64_05575 [Ignavibacteria bacterium GWF2_33_9]|nr:MAG: hypothetical protein A2X64_05575 [Ignavibacteria bacterium GWF2_33_9]
MAQNYQIDSQLSEVRFICDLDKCKGACCTIYGDTGAPLLEEELELIAKNLDAAKEYLSERSLRYLDKYGFWMKDDLSGYATKCIRNQDCVLVYYEGDVAKCSLEKAYFQGKSDFRKPISCHLFPIRIRDNKIVYEEFHVCKPALELGEQEDLKVYQFLKEPIIRKFGDKFYDEMDSFFEKKLNK